MTHSPSRYTAAPTKKRRQAENRMRQAVSRRGRKRAAARMKNKLDRFVVEPDRTWHVVRAKPRWAHKLANDLAKVDVLAFQARDEVEVVGRNGRRRTVRAPLLRRVLFIGVASGESLDAAAAHPGMDKVFYRDGRLVTVKAEDLQLFVDFVTGQVVDEALLAGSLFTLGQDVRVTDGPFAGFPGLVEAFDLRTGIYKVCVHIFGRPTPVELEKAQIEAA